MNAVFVGKNESEIEIQEARTKTYLEQLEAWAQYRLKSYNVMTAKSREEKRALAKLSIYDIGYLRVDYAFKDGFYSFWSDSLPGLCACGRDLNEILDKLPSIIRNLTIVIFGTGCMAERQLAPETIEEKGQILFLIKPEEEE